MIDILLQPRRDRRAAERFFRKLLKGQGGVPRRMVTDKLRSYAAAKRTIMRSVAHDTSQYANNRAEVSHEPTRQRERGKCDGFKSMAQAQRFLSVHGITQNLFRVGRHLLRAANYRTLRDSCLRCMERGGRVLDENRGQPPTAGRAPITST